MNPLLLALIAPVLAAAGFGALLGASIAHAKQEFRTGDHPVLDFAIKRRHPLLNIVLGFGSWVLLFYGIPKAAFAAVGIDDIAAYGISAGCQVAALYVSMLVAERIWS